MKPLFFFICFFALQLPAFNQLDKKKLDSLTSRINSGSRNMKNWQDSFQKEQDSIYKLNVQTRRDLPNKKISKKYQKDEKKQAIILLSVVTLIVILSASVILKRKKPDNN